MSGTANLNIILSQGNAVNEVNNIRKQNLELNQQYVVQHADIKKRKEKNAIRKPSKGGDIDVENEKRKENMKGRGQKAAGKELAENETEAENGRLIDIVV